MRHTDVKTARANVEGGKVNCRGEWGKVVSRVVMGYNHFFMRVGKRWSVIWFRGGRGGLRCRFPRWFLLSERSR